MLACRHYIICTDAFDQGPEPAGDQSIAHKRECRGFSVSNGRSGCDPVQTALNTLQFHALSVK